jgi:hypothetical protein
VDNKTIEESAFVSGPMSQRLLVQILPSTICWWFGIVRLLGFHIGESHGFASVFLFTGGSRTTWVVSIFGGLFLAGFATLISFIQHRRHKNRAAQLVSSLLDVNTASESENEHDFKGFQNSM